MVRFDKETREAIKDAVQNSVSEVLLTLEERYLTSDQLIEQFGMFSKDWMARNAWRLPRKRVEIEVHDDKGSSIATRWAYPKHKISKMIEEGMVLR